VFKVWRAGVATVAVALLSSALIVLDLSDGAFRRWWSARAFTTDALAGILVVLITVLIVNRALGSAEIANDSARRQRRPPWYWVKPFAPPERYWLAPHLVIAPPHLTNSGPT
jgi:hypothetical protein